MWSARRPHKVCISPGKRGRVQFPAGFSVFTTLKWAVFFFGNGPLLEHKLEFSVSGYLPIRPSASVFSATAD
jgi:hypothetical protein